MVVVQYHTLTLPDVLMLLVVDLQHSLHPDEAEASQGCAPKGRLFIFEERGSEENRDCREEEGAAESSNTFPNGKESQGYMYRCFFWNQA